MSSIVVADAGPLHYLIQIGHTEVLEHLFHRVLAPFSVRDELLHENAPKQVREWVGVSKPWLQFQPVTSLPIIAGIHQGESDALRLAREIKAAAVLMDDMDGRTIARRLGLITVGTIGILERAAEKNLVDLPVAIAKLRLTNFFASKELLDAVLARDRARKAG